MNSGDFHLAPRIVRDYRRVYHVLESLDRATQSWAVVSPGSECPHRNIIVFPGSFNPPTVAHLAMLRQARRFARRRYTGRWQVYAALSRQVVDKERVERMTQLDRVVLLEHVLQKQVRRAGVLLLNRGLYVEQARGIRTAFPRVRRLIFLVGFDKLVQILDPRYYSERDASLRELFALAHLLVAPRGGDGRAELQALLARPENRPFAPFIAPLPLDARYRDVSSTHARQEAEPGDLPAQARDFILRTHPYTQPSRQADEDMGGRDPYAERTQALFALLANGRGGKSAD